MFYYPMSIPTETKNDTTWTIRTDRATARKCPVCEGNGRLTLNPYGRLSVYWRICHGCNGRGMGEGVVNVAPSTP